MTRLLHAPTVDGAARRLDAPAPVLDQAMRELLARTEAEAHARGRADGARDAADAAAKAGQQAMEAIATAVRDLRSALHEDAAGRAAAVAELGRRLAQAILGTDLREGGTAMVERVLAAVEALDHGPFTVHVAARDHALLADHVHALPPDTSLVVDDRLAAGESRITGPWSGADLTFQAMLDALTEVPS